MLRILIAFLSLFATRINSSKATRHSVQGPSALRPCEGFARQKESTPSSVPLQILARATAARWFGGKDDVGWLNLTTQRPCFCGSCLSS
jgi:hypothetical protein